jgi:hypothetical protein
MTDQDPGVPSEETPLTDTQRAFLAEQAARHAANAASPAADQAATAAQMTERGPALPAEEQMDKLMAALAAQADQIAALTAQVGVMQKQNDEQQEAVGGPPVIRYAKAVLEKVNATAVAHPDLGPDHFAEPKDAAQALVDAATALNKTGGATTDVESAATRLDRWFTRTHWRTGKKFIDFSAVVDDVATAVDEALKLAA